MHKMMMLVSVIAVACSSSTPAAPELNGLKTVSMIGSTLDPVEMGGNPYGLAIAPITAGLMTAGDLVVCNFNDGATNTQGGGTTIVGLHPTVGATPYHVAQDHALLGCNAITMLADDTISVSAYGTNENPLVSPAGVVSNPLSTDTFGDPWGEAYVAASGSTPAAVYVSNVLGGGIDRITLNGDAQASFTEIAKGYCGSGMPGAIYAPSGLTYDPAIDALYIVDSSSNSVTVFDKVSAIGADGVIATSDCMADVPTAVPTYTGPSASSAKVIASGGQFNGPLSAALLHNGNIVVGNADLNQPSQFAPNLMFEISATDGVVATQQMDTGAPGALFGIVATEDAHGDQLVYFNDDNLNTVMLLSK